MDDLTAAQYHALTRLHAQRLGELSQLVRHAIQRLAMMEAQLHALHSRLDALEGPREERQKLPFFQRKRAVSGVNPPEKEPPLRRVPVTEPTPD